MSDSPIIHNRALLGEQQVAADETADVTDLLYASLEHASQAYSTALYYSTMKRKGDSLVARETQRRRLEQEEVLETNQADQASYEELPCAVISGKTEVAGDHDGDAEQRLRSEDCQQPEASVAFPAVSRAVEASVEQIGHAIPTSEVSLTRKTFTELMEQIQSMPVFVEEDVYNIPALAKRSRELLALLQQHLLPMVGDRPWTQLLTFTLRLIRAMAAERLGTAVGLDFDLKQLGIDKPNAVLSTLVKDHSRYSEYEKYAMLKVMWLGTPLYPQTELQDTADLQIHAPLKSVHHKAHCILQVGTSDFVGTFNERRKHAHFWFRIDHGELGPPALEIHLLINKNLSQGFVDLANQDSYHEICLVWQATTGDFTHLFGYGRKGTDNIFRQLADLAGAKISGSREPPEEKFEGIAQERIFNISFIPLRTQSRNHSGFGMKMRMWQCLRNVDPTAYDMICQLTYPPAPVSIWFVVDCDGTEEFWKKNYQPFFHCWAQSRAQVK